MKTAKSKKTEMVDGHLAHIIKNTTALDRMIWLKKSTDFWKKMQIAKHKKIIKFCQD